MTPADRMRIVDDLKQIVEDKDALLERLDARSVTNTREVVADLVVSVARLAQAILTLLPDADEHDRYEDMPYPD